MTTDLVQKSTKTMETKNDAGENFLRVGVIGYGYWGPNIVRNFHGQERSRVVAVCDKSPKSQKRVKQAYPDMRVTDDANELLTATDIDVIAVVTPVWTHFELAKAAL
jgi:predicted dehydrogenase